MTDIINAISPLEGLMRKHFYGWQQTVSSVAAVGRYSSMGFKTLSPELCIDKKGDTAFILGSGPTINDLTADDWRMIGDNTSIAFNKFIAHKFIPDIYFIQGNRYQENAVDFQHCYDKRRNEYRSVTWIARGDLVNQFAFHKSPSCARVMNENKENFIFSPELFVHSNANINPRRLVSDLIDRMVLVHGRLPLILPKVGATVPMIHLFAGCLGFRKIVLCGIDMYDDTHFYDAQYNSNVFSRFELSTSEKPTLHPHLDSKVREFSIRRILIDQSRELYQKWQVETFCMSSRSAIYPAIPLYPRCKPRMGIKQVAKSGLRIAMLTPSFLPKMGGMEIQLDGLATRLAQRGHDVTVFAPKPLRQPFPSRPYRIIEFEPRVLGNTFSSSPRIKPLGFIKTSLPRLFRIQHMERSFDVISSHSAYLTSNMACAFRELYDVPIVTRCHGLDINKLPQYNYGWRLDPKKDHLITSSLKQSDKCIAISSDVFEQLLEIVGPEQISQIHNGIDTELFRPGLSAVLQQKLGLAEQMKCLLCVGRNTPIKNFPLLVAAMKTISDARSDIHLVFIGDGCGPLVGLARDLGVGDRVHVLESVPNSTIPEYYRSAHLFISPSILETFGTVTAEAMASGLPVVGFDVPGTRDQVIHGETGFLVRERTPYALAKAILNILSNPDRLAQMAARGRARAVHLFSWDTTVDHYEALFRQVASLPYYKTVHTGQGMRAEVEAFDRQRSNIFYNPKFLLEALLEGGRLVLKRSVWNLLKLCLSVR